MRHKFRVRTQLKDDLGRNIIKILRDCSWIAKLNHVRVLLINVETPSVRRSENFSATCFEHIKKFTPDIPLAFHHHLVKYPCPFRLRDTLPPWVTFSFET